MTFVPSRLKLQTIARALSRSLEKLQRSSKEPSADEGRVEAALEAIESYELLAGEVYRLRARGASDPGQKAAEELLATAAHDLVGFTQAERGTESGYRLFVREYRATWRRHFGLFIFTACLFLATCFLGWNLGVNQPDYLPLFVDQKMLEMMLDHQAWFERLQENPIMGGVEIAANNIMVSIRVFVFGTLLGIGGLYLLGYNGLLFGATLGYCWSHGFDEPLLTFITSHGPLELTIIVASAFASFLLGRVFYLRPFSQLRARLHEGARESFTLVIGIVPWLILAATLEAGISPWPSIPIETKIWLGILAASAFWLWTLWPGDYLRKQDKSLK